jgi:hypothetical protein
LTSLITPTVIAPTILKNVLSEDKFNVLKDHALDLYENRYNFDPYLGRYMFGKTEILKDVHESLSDLAKEVFKSETLMPAWSMMVGYTGSKAVLPRHIDDNASSYHIDLCIFENKEWPIGVEYNSEDKYYALHENEALAMCGDSQYHWRNPLNGTNDDIVFNAFLVYCEPSHWYFTEGPEYIERIRVMSKRNKIAAYSSLT